MNTLERFTKPKDPSRIVPPCAECKLTTGTVIGGAAGYTWYHARKAPNPVGRLSMLAVAGAAAAFAVFTVWEGVELLRAPPKGAASSGAASSSTASSGTAPS
eukprot:c4968_g1_i1.p2 GENE.c4968_g1_i1~~c4968_g1_i1.p2  ORF type:complete len:102 (+),score=10.50 c4968_g1_i1:144-449(+)